MNLYEIWIKVATIKTKYTSIVHTFAYSFYIFYNSYRSVSYGDICENPTTNLIKYKRLWKEDILTLFQNDKVYVA